MGFNRMIKDVIWGSVIKYNSSKLLYDTVILKDREKDRELIFFTIIKHLLKNKKGLLFLLIIQNKVGVDYEKKPSI